MVIAPNDISRLKNYYYDNIQTLTHHGSMNKIQVVDNWERGLSDILGKYLPSRPVGDNFYYHEYPYLPHADNREGIETYNWVIPIETSHPQTFIVFDQKITTAGRTWVGDIEMDVSILEPNTAIRESFVDSGIVEGLTDRPIDDELYEFLPYFHKDYYFGMTGKVYDWVPGNIIKFDSRQIHMTGKMDNSRKLGMTIRLVQ